MLRRLSPLLLIALLLTPAVAQEEPARVLELRIVSMSRGYMRPMSATAERIGQVPGIESVEALGFGGDTARYRVATRLDDDALARALQLTVIGRGEDRLVLTGTPGRRAERAEARGVITQIAQAITDMPKPTWARETDPLFGPGMRIHERMRRLGLDPAMLNGTFYKPADYHIEEEWDGNSGSYKVWAGDQDESVYVPDDDWWRDEDGRPEAAAPNADSRFVGVRLYRSPWNSSLSWVDVEGLSLAGYGFSRGDTDHEGRLYVSGGAEWMTDILAAVAAILVRDPKTQMNQLPKGRGWGLVDRIPRDNRKVHRWDVPHYDYNELDLRWREDDDRRIATLRAHHPAHPFYLEAEVDMTAVVEDYQARAQEAELDLTQVQEAELGAALTWICGAEESAESFERLRNALVRAAEKHPAGELCGSLDDEVLRGRLGIELKAGHFAPADFVIRPQMLGDVEISVGSARTGGRYWMLLNAGTGTIIRSSP
jgi:hypothetical protein